jgi:heme-degrading monooxygenase HmoA
MRQNQYVTLINAIVVPADQIEPFITDWNADKAYIVKQPGFIDGVLYRTVLPNARYRCVNVARWESEDAWKNAIEAAERERSRRGIDRIAESTAMGVSYTPSLYREEIRY